MMDDTAFRRDGSPVKLSRRRCVLTRRAFLRSATAWAAGPLLLPLGCRLDRSSVSARRPVRLGLVTDCHYADADPAGTRHYRTSLQKLAECVTQMNAERLDFLIELGDFKDQNRPPVEQATLAHLEAVEAEFQRFDGPTYHVLGNHDMDSISKAQFLARVTNTGVDPARSYYSFDVSGLHNIVLDANYTATGADYDHGAFDWTDANIPGHELAWLERDLAATAGPVMVFIHQLLDGAGAVYVNNAAEVRQILEASGQVRAVFQGHHHEGAYRQINGIHYMTLPALVEGPGPEDNAYAIAEVRLDQTIDVTGYRKAPTRALMPRGG